MKQPHTEETIQHTDDQQNTGNHRKSDAENAEGSTNRDAREESIETGTDVDRVSGLDEANTSTKQVDNSRERHPERDEHGRM